MVGVIVVRAFEPSPPLYPLHRKQPGAMIVRSPSNNVDWKKVGKPMRVIYQVEFASANNQIVSQTKGLLGR
jgi:hypothetical protein